ncbi:MAG: serpin family protein [Nocardioides sp.]
MLTRRDTLRAVAAAGVVAPVLTACDGGGAAPTGPGGGSTADLRLVTADVPRSAGSEAAVPVVVTSMAAFTDDLWPHLAGATQNLALSPYSIDVALAMTANGATGATKAQMMEVLHLDSLATFNTGIAALTRQVDSLAGPVQNSTGKPGQVALAAANALFGDRATTWAKTFLTVLAKQYGAGMRDVDFRTAPERARSAVNAWTSQQTHDRIPQILPPGSVDQLTRLVLVDALYFKAPWDLAFDDRSTSRRQFHVTPERTVGVDMMTSTDNASYLVGTHYRGARLDYAGRRLAMTVALAEGDERAALHELLGDLGRTPDGTPVLLSMPRWTFRAASPLTPPLQQLGMTLAFDPTRADFSAMTADERLYVADALHQTFVAVDEQGTEAAAATAVVMGATSGQANPETLVLERPFLFAIHDTAHGTPLFVGRVADPS